MFSRIEFILTETFQGLRRHMVMAFAAIACVMSVLFVAGMVMLAILNADQLVQSGMERVRFVAFFYPETTREEAMNAYERITKIPGIDTAGTQFIPREQPWKQFKKEQRDLGQLYGRNPLPDCINVKPVNIADIPALKMQLKQFPEVETVIDEQNVSQFLQHALNAIKQGGLVVSIILAFLSLVIIHHTIELTIFARRKEIHIMALVGATPMTIGMPFLLEGIIYGLLGGGIACGLLAAAYNFALSWALQHVETHLLWDPRLVPNGIALLLVAGIALGFFGSMGSVVKYLRRPKSRVTNA